MYMDLQDEYGERELLLGKLHAQMMKDVFDFINPNGSDWDASIDDFDFSGPSLPLNGFEPAPIIDSEISILTDIAQPHYSPFVPYQHEALKGSNSWAVTGELTPYASAMLANDMHLGIGVPNIWYRASAKYEINNQHVEVHGVILPGTPALIVGSNTHIAWGFTNSYGDWSDLIKVDQLSDTEYYDTPEGPKKFETGYEIIKVKGQPPVEVEIKKTIWGPIIASENGNLFAMRWVAHDPEGVNFNLLDLVLTQTASSAVEVAKTMGIPAQNFTVVDSQGNAAWTIAGAIPNKKNRGFTQLQWQIPQALSQTSINKTQIWDGYLPFSEYPLIFNPNSNRIWTGNSRVVGGKELNKIGNGGYALGARSQQISKNLYSKKNFTEEDFLNIQNDDRAEFLTRWHRLITDTVIPNSDISNQQKETLQKHLSNWQQRASIESVSYTIVREFRLQLRRILFSELFAQSLQTEPQSINFRPIRSQLESPMWMMITEQPKHLLLKSFNSWQSLFDFVLINMIDNLEECFGDISKVLWGIVN